MHRFADVWLKQMVKVFYKSFNVKMAKIVPTLLVGGTLTAGTILFHKPLHYTIKGTQNQPVLRLLWQTISEPLPKILCLLYVIHINDNLRIVFYSFLSGYINKKYGAMPSNLKIFKNHRKIFFWENPVNFSLFCTVYKCTGSMCLCKLSVTDIILICLYCLDAPETAMDNLFMCRSLNLAFSLFLEYTRASTCASNTLEQSMCVNKQTSKGLTICHYETWWWAAATEP